MVNQPMDQGIEPKSRLVIAPVTPELLRPEVKLHLIGDDALDCLAGSQQDWAHGAGTISAGDANQQPAFLRGFGDQVCARRNTLEWRGSGLRGRDLGELEALIEPVGSPQGEAEELRVVSWNGTAHRLFDDYGAPIVVDEGTGHFFTRRRDERSCPRRHVSGAVAIVAGDETNVECRA